MKRFCLLLIFNCFCGARLLAQNVGIGTTTPAFPLSFPSTLGNKIGLWGNSGNHYGLGVQSGLLQLYSDLPSSNIVFGHGSSTSFTERMRIINSGVDGMYLNGRISLRNGTSPLNQASGPGVWLFRADNTAPLGFMGTQDNQNIGFFGGPAGWGFTYNALNSRVGIGNNNPNAPLSFAPTLGKKITLYPGATGDVGFGVAGNRLQIYTDNPNADVALGYDAGGVFTERLAIKANGAITVNGNAGAPGQILQSNGNAAAPTWVTKPAAPYVITYEQSVLAQLHNPAGLFKDIPGLHDQYFTLASPSTVVFTANARFNSGQFVAASFGYLEIMILNAFNQSVGVAKAHGSSLDTRSATVHAVGTANLPAGTYHTQVRYYRRSDLDGNMDIGDGIVVLQVVPN
jgi:hypothetical protein